MTILPNHTVSIDDIGFFAENPDVIKLNGFTPDSVKAAFTIEEINNIENRKKIE